MPADKEQKNIFIVMVIATVVLGGGLINNLSQWEKDGEDRTGNVVALSLMTAVTALGALKEWQKL